MDPYVMSLDNFKLIALMTYHLDRACDRSARNGPWLSRTTNSVYVLLPTGRVVATNSYTAGLYAHDAAWLGVEPSQEIIDYCEGVTPATLPTDPLTTHRPNPLYWNGTRLESPE
jgi:hypothetical protein